MSKSKIWVWYGENASEHDVNNWHMLRKLLQLNIRDGDYIIEFINSTELREFENSLQDKGWQIDVEATDNTPHLRCWQRGFAFSE